jgi:hypothetical protein
MEHTRYIFEGHELERDRPVEGIRLIPEHAGDGGTDVLESPLSVEHADHVARVFDERPEVRFASPQRSARAASIGAALGLFELARDRRSQPGEITLHHVVVRSRLHRGDRHFFADVPDAMMKGVRPQSGQFEAQTS